MKHNNSDASGASILNIRVSLPCWKTLWSLFTVLTFVESLPAPSYARHSVLVFLNCSYQCLLDCPPYSRHEHFCILVTDFSSHYHIMDLAFKYIDGILHFSVCFILLNTTYCFLVSLSLGLSCVFVMSWINYGYTVILMKNPLNLIYTMGINVQQCRILGS
jgi:hypothetical protein